MKTSVGRSVQWNYLRQWRNLESEKGLRLVKYTTHIGKPKGPESREGETGGVEDDGKRTLPSLVVGFLPQRTGSTFPKMDR